MGYVPPRQWYPTGTEPAGGPYTTPASQPILDAIQNGTPLPTNTPTTDSSSGSSGGTGLLNGANPPTQDSSSNSSDIGSPPSPGNTAPAPLPTVNASPSPTPPTNDGSTGLSFAQVKNFWIQAGGNPQAADMAAAVADAESGLNAAAQRTNPDGSTGVGLWLIPQNGTPPGSTDPLANARAAVQLSQNGTDWTQWCSTWSDNNCGQDNGTYLGQGANALMSLQGQSPGASNLMFGSVPSGNGVGASSITGTSKSSTSSKSSVLPFIIIIAVTGLIIFLAMHKTRAEQGSQEQGE